MFNWHCDKGARPISAGASLIFRIVKVHLKCRFREVSLHMLCANRLRSALHIHRLEILSELSLVLQNWIECPIARWMPRHQWTGIFKKTHMRKIGEDKSDYVLLSCTTWSVLSPPIILERSEYDKGCRNKYTLMNIGMRTKFTAEKQKAWPVPCI